MVLLAVKVKTKGQRVPPVHPGRVIRSVDDRVEGRHREIEGFAGACDAPINLRNRIPSWISAERIPECVVIVAPAELVD